MLTSRQRSLEITKSGALFILFALAVGFAAINSGSNLLHVLFGAQMAMILASGVLSEVVVQRVTARRVPTGALYAKTPGRARVQIRNGDLRRQVFSVSVEDDDRTSHRGSCGPVFAVRIPSRGFASLDCPVVLPRRGRNLFPPAVVSTRFPFGLFIKRRELPPTGEVLVYPKVSPVSAEDIERFLAEGSAAGLRVGRSGEFFALREYRPGDEMRRVHWPAVARTGRLVVREDQDTRVPSLWIPLPTGSTGDRAFETALERTASVAVALLQGGAAVGLVRGTEVLVDPGLGVGQGHRLLATLAEIGGPWPDETEGG